VYSHLYEERTVDKLHQRNNRRVRSKGFIASSSRPSVPSDRSCSYHLARLDYRPALEFAKHLGRMQPPYDAFPPGARAPLVVPASHSPRASTSSHPDQPVPAYPTAGSSSTACASTPTDPPGKKRKKALRACVLVRFRVVTRDAP